jgi:hypothetical protein
MSGHEIDLSALTPETASFQNPETIAFDANHTDIIFRTYGDTVAWGDPDHSADPIDNATCRAIIRTEGNQYILGERIAINTREQACRDLATLSRGLPATVIGHPWEIPGFAVTTNVQDVLLAGKANAAQDSPRENPNDPFVYAETLLQSALKSRPQVPAQNRAEHSAAYEADKRAVSFKTSKGSVYTYDEDGKTTRYKTATGERNDRQDLTIFADLSPEENENYLLAFHSPDRNYKVAALELQDDMRPRRLTDVAQVENRDRIYLSVLYGSKTLQAKKAELQPSSGANVFDTRQFIDENGQLMTERHIGHKVTDITYEQ